MPEPIISEANEVLWGGLAFVAIIAIVLIVGLALIVRARRH